MNSVQLTAQKKRISAKCLKCAYKPICNGGCPKHRITKVNNETVSYFCEGYKILFSTMVPYMNAMVELAKKPEYRFTTLWMLQNKWRIINNALF